MAERKPIKIGTRFGLWTVLEPINAGVPPFNYKCICDCGTESVRSSRLIRNGGESCGCLMRERHAAVVKKHGRTGTSEYHIWQHMRRRCTDPSTPLYHRYGGRGIKVCARWESFENFLSDMGERPPGKTIDRINNDGNYEPDNCRWATRREQMRNMSRNVHITIGGITQCANDWESVSGINHTTIIYRFESGWPENMILSPKKHMKVTSERFRMLTYGGVTLNLKDMAARYGLTPKALSTRLARGFDLERALTQSPQIRRRAG